MLTADSTLTHFATVVLASPSGGQVPAAILGPLRSAGQLLAQLPDVIDVR
jgi:hypothetical protein